MEITTTKLLVMTQQKKPLTNKIETKIGKLTVIDHKKPQLVFSYSKFDYSSGNV